MRLTHHLKRRWPISLVSRLRCTLTLHANPVAADCRIMLLVAPLYIVILTAWWLWNVFIYGDWRTWTRDVWEGMVVSWSSSSFSISLVLHFSISSSKSSVIFPMRHALVKYWRSLSGRYLQALRNCWTHLPASLQKEQSTALFDCGTLTGTSSWLSGESSEVRITLSSPAARDSSSKDGTACDT